MSPIGRVFIVLNLILAGTFVGFSGTYLQKQYHWKSAFEKRDAEATEQIKQLSSENERVSGELSRMTTSKNTLEQQLGSASNERDQAKDEVKRLQASHDSKDADLKRLASEISGIKTDADAAFAQAKEAYNASIAAMQAKDEAVNTKNATAAENRDLKNQIAALEDSVKNKDLSIADLTKERGQLKLLVDVAKAKGFTEGMAVPRLGGTVAQVTGKLCTITVTDNKAGAEVAEGTSFAIYDASGYKAEARVTRYSPENNAAFCTIDVKSGDVKPGDLAATQLGGL